jgi:hypothetical protein
MPKNIELSGLTENQAKWFKELIEKAADEALGMARNSHLFALGAKTQEDSVAFEMFADENRDYARILREIASSLETYGDILNSQC